MKDEQWASQHQLVDGTLNQQIHGNTSDLSTSILRSQLCLLCIFYTVFVGSSFVFLQAPASITVVFFAEVHELSFNY